MEESSTTFQRTFITLPIDIATAARRAYEYDWMARMLWKGWV
jgi:hypothetical protein